MMNPPHQEAQLSMPLLMWVSWQRKRRTWQVRVRVKVKVKVRVRVRVKMKVVMMSSINTAHLRKKDKLMVLKLIEKIDEQEETLHKQEEFLINKIKCLEKLTKKHEKLKCSHASLVERYENLSIEQTHTINFLSCVAKLEDENYVLKDKVERLTSKNEILREDHDELLCTHEKLMDSHLMLEIAHEVVVTTVKSYQPHTHKCTCTQVPFILSCANNCCYQASQPSVEHVLLP